MWAEFSRIDTEIIAFGVYFRSASHLRWFILSAAGMITGLSLAAYAICFLKGSGYLFHRAMRFLSHAAFAHLGIAVVAVFCTRFGTENGRVYSVDCIFFNSLVFLVYLFLLAQVNKIACRRHGSEYFSPKLI